MYSFLRCVNGGRYIRRMLSHSHLNEFPLSPTSRIHSIPKAGIPGNRNPAPQRWDSILNSTSKPPNLQTHHVIHHPLALFLTSTPPHNFCHTFPPFFSAIAYSVVKSSVIARLVVPFNILPPKKNPPPSSSSSSS